METTNNAGHDHLDGGDLDPRAELAMLDRVQNATEVEAWMPPTPVWHAPLLAAAIAGAALVNSGPTFAWSIVGLIVGGVALLVGCVDQIRRMRARPRRLRKPMRVFLFYALITLVTLLVLSLWSGIDWPAGYLAQVAIVVGMWLVTTLVFALGITTTNRLRERWAAAAT